MSTEIRTCPIWGETFEAEGVYLPRYRRLDVYDSTRSFYGYSISEILVNAFIKNMSSKEKARLTTWIVDQGMHGVELPRITEEVIAHARSKWPLPVHARADRLLRLLALATNNKGIGVPIAIPRNDYMYYAWSESTDWSEIEYLLKYLTQKEWLEVAGLDQRGYAYSVTIAGHSRAEEFGNQGMGTVSTQAFVAMWIDSETDDAFEKGIRPGIEDAGYEALRIDKKQDVVKIDDEIMSEIRRSRLVVADFTHGESGVRGGVYFEAGFAEGLGIPVIYTCRKDMIGELHFDTRQYAHILWNEPEQFRLDIRNRIRARIGSISAR